MTVQSVTILCGKCRVGIEGPAEADPKAIYTCPSCGNSDNLENVMASVEAHSEEIMGQSFDKMARDKLRGSIIQVTSNSPPKRLHPFITDLKL